METTSHQQLTTKERVPHRRECEFDKFQSGVQGREPPPPTLAPGFKGATETQLWLLALVLRVRSSDLYQRGATDVCLEPRSRLGPAGASEGATALEGETRE